VIELAFVIDTKRTKQQCFQTTWTKASLVLNLGHGIKKSKAKTWCMHNMKCNKTLLQKHDNNKDLYPKLVLNRLKGMWDSISIYTHWAPSSKKFLIKLSTYMWPMFTHVWPMCGPCPSMWELVMNYELTKSELEVNWNLTMN
jgi:hypothetical protein